MDLRAYYQKIRTIEAGISEPDVVIVSRGTPEGGRPGVKTAVPRRVAARFIAEGKADLATPEEAAQFQAEVEARWKAVSPGGGEARAVRGKPKAQRKSRGED